MSNSAAGRSPRDAPGAAAMFAALGDPTRLAIVEKLGDGRQRSITELGQDSAFTRQAVSKHLRVLEDAGLARRRRVGRETLYALNPEAIAGLRAHLEAVSRRWDDALARLKAHVER